MHKIIELHGMNYYTMMMHDDEEKLTNWLSDQLKTLANFAQGCEVESDEEVEEGEEEGARGTRIDTRKREGRRAQEILILLRKVGILSLLITISSTEMLLHKNTQRVVSSHFL